MDHMTEPLGRHLSDHVIARLYELAMFEEARASVALDNDPRCQTVEIPNIDEERGSDVHDR